MSMNTAPLPRRSLVPEPWGRKLLRAREDMAGLRLQDAADLASRWMLTSTAAISRLEARTEAPGGGRQQSQRQRAYILCLAYEVDPAELDLGPDDLPPNLAVPNRTPADLRESPTIWYDVTAGRRLAPVERIDDLAA